MHSLKARLVNGSGQRCQGQQMLVEKGHWEAVGKGSEPSLGKEEDAEKL